MSKNSELIVQYTFDDVYKLPFDLNKVHSWMIEYGILLVKHKESDENYVEYTPTFDYFNDHEDPFHFPDKTFIRPIDDKKFFPLRN